MRFPLSRLVALVLSAIGFFFFLVPAEAQQFSPPANYPLFPGAASTFKVADVTGDSRPDVVSVERSSFLAGSQWVQDRPLLSVLVGQANGSLTPRPLVQLAADGRFVGPFAVGRVDGDTRADIVYGRDFSETIVLRSQPNGTYLSSTIPDYGSLLVVGDVTGDGNGDVIIGASENTWIKVYVGDGNGGFLGQTVFEYAEGGAFALADVNEDGKLDLVVSGYSGVWALLGSPDGYYLPLVAGPRTYDHYFPTPATALSLADFNGDGHLDAVGTSPFARAQLFYGDGHGGFEPSGLIGPADAMAAAAGDFNGDGLADIAITNHPTGTSLYLGNGQGVFTGPVAVALATPAPGQWMPIAAADLNQDAREDLMVLGLRTTDLASSITVALQLGPPPTVDAGPPVTAMANTLGIATVSLNGVVTNGLATSVLWSEGGTSLASVASPTVQLAVGVHTLTFSATVAGNVMTDTVVISVHLPTSAGAIGATGPQGPQGLQGPQGPAGAAGPQGPAGADGAKGDKGDAGATGAKGDTGADGAIGPAGPQGPQGPAGADGAKGDVGAKGDKGDAGANGTNGADGAKGDKGDTGAQGPAGTNGVDGAEGDTGADGAIGPQGPAGTKGDKGDAGANGADGAKGDKGDTGAQGPAGTNGVDGAKGDTGADGAIGPQGPAGAKGDTGLAGATGATGPQGPAGATGAKGDTGADGAAGATGPQGPQGLQGLQGPAGVTGANGAKGDTGATGATGPQGVAGPKGASGATGATGAAGAPGAKGDKGDVGPAGPKGATGANGINGTNGTNGTNAVAIKDSLLLMPDNIAAPAGYRRIGEFTEEAIDSDGRGGQRRFKMTIVIWQKL